MLRNGCDEPGDDRAAKILLAIFFLTLVGCATPVGVRKVDHAKAYQTLTASVLSGEGLSEPTLQVVNRAGLGEVYRDAPADAIADLHHSISTRRDSDLLFALAELCFQHGERSGDNAYFLSAAAYAYAFLFPERSSDTPDPFDPRFRTAVDLYNQGIIRGFTAPTSGIIDLKSGTYRVPFGRLVVTVDPQDFFYGHYRLVDFADASQLIPRGLRNRYRWHLLLKGDRLEPLHRLTGLILKEHPSAGVNLTVDVDPESML